MICPDVYNSVLNFDVVLFCPLYVYTIYVRYMYTFFVHYMCTFFFRYTHSAHEEGISRAIQRVSI